MFKHQSKEAILRKLDSMKFEIWNIKGDLRLLPHPEIVAQLQEIYTLIDKVEEKMRGVNPRLTKKG